MTLFAVCHSLLLIYRVDKYLDKSSRKWAIIRSIERSIKVFYVKHMRKLAWILLIVGGLNWGLVGLGMLFGGMGWNVVNMILGGWPMVEGIVYLLVGISALWLMMPKKQMGGTM